jgi:hypothetical protein
MSTSLSPRSGAGPSRARRSSHRRWLPGVVGAALLVGSGVMARMNTRATVEPPATSTSSPGARTSGDVRTRVVDLLDASQGRPREDALRQLGPEAVPVLTEVLADARAPADRRASAAVALARCQGLDAIPTLLTRLQDREDRVSEAVAVTLGRLGGQQVRQALEDRLPVEERPLVREALQRGLTLVEP